MWWPHSTYAHSTVSTPPLTSTVKSSLFTHMHSSSLSLAARLHQYHANHSCYINSGWPFPGQTSLFNWNVCSNADSDVVGLEWEPEILHLQQAPADASTAGSPITFLSSKNLNRKDTCKLFNKMTRSWQFRLLLWLRDRVMHPFSLSAPVVCQ